VSRGMEKVKVKILGLSMAHRKGRNTAWMVEYALKAAEKFGRKVSDIADIETDFIDLAQKKIERCWECPDYPCRPNKGLPWEGSSVPEDFGCPITGDYLALEVMPKVAEADGFVFGCAVFNGTCTSQFITVMERFRAGIWKGYFTNKPAASIANATMQLAGQESLLQQMNNVTRFLEMIPVATGLGAVAIAGPPYGPLAANDDGKVIAAKNDTHGQRQSVLVGRRVAEFAVMIALAKQQLGERYAEEFARYYTSPHGKDRWAWFDLDREDHEYLMNLTPSTFRK
jgi:multimeric flavodoxin WrbA